MDKIKLACDRARAEIPLTFAEANLLADKVAELETENAALRKAAEPRPMSDAPRDGMTIRVFSDVWWEACDQHWRNAEGQRVHISWRADGWLPCPPPTDTAKPSQAAPTLSLSDLSDGNARQSEKVDLGKGLPTHYVVHHEGVELTGGIDSIVLHPVDNDDEKAGE